MKTRKELMEAIRIKRIEIGLSQQKLADKVGIKPSYLSEAERGVKVPSLKIAFRLAQEVGVDMSSIVPQITSKELQSMSSKSLPWRDSHFTQDVIKASSSFLQIMGINSLRPLHEHREDILNLLNRGSHVQVCILDVQSEAFQIRQEQECKNLQTEKTSHRLEGEFIASLSILSDILNFRTRGELEVRLYSNYPVAAIVIADGRFLEYNPYRKEKSTFDSAPTSCSRGLHNPVKLLAREDDKKLFDEITELYKSVWSVSKPIELRTYFNQIWKYIKKSFKE